MRIHWDWEVDGQEFAVEADYFVGYIAVLYKNSGIKDVFTLKDVAFGTFVWDRTIGRLVLLRR